VFTNEYINEIKAKLPTLPEQKISWLVKHHQLDRKTASLIVVQHHYSYFKQAAKLSPSSVSSTTIANMIVNKKIDPKKISPRRLVDQILKKAQTQITDPKTLTPIINQVIKTNPQAVESYQQGKISAITFLIGQVMAKTKGRAEPQLTNKLLTKQLK
jgi:Asp-tRNA(Asn)/Glu-tRNA(Gln) amidotransferase B subunit